MINKKNLLTHRIIIVSRLIAGRINSIIIRIRKSVEFYYDYLQFKKFIKNQKIDKEVEVVDDEKICITVIPWLGSAVPWYSVTIALMLYKKGKNISVLFDDMPFGDDKLYHRLQSKLIFNILMKLPIKFTKLSDYQSFKITDSEIDDLIKFNSLHAIHGENNIIARQLYEKIIKEQLSLIYSKIASLYEEEKFPKILLPGGIWGSSCIFPLFAKKNNTQVITYDAGESRLVLSIYGVAAQLQDIPYCFNKILKNPREKKFAIQRGFHQLERRRAGKDMISYFKEDTDTSQFGNDYYLMLLNSVWDSATLGLHTVYNSMNEWMFDSIEWILKNTEKKIIIRQHPAERAKDLNNTDSYNELIEKKFGQNKRVIFIEATKDINTYNLIENAICVLGFSSTIIVESVALGKVSIIVSSTYYADFGIVYNAKDKREYYMYLAKASINELKNTQEMKDRACISNYITQSCNWYKTKFTPVRGDYLAWSKLNLHDLENDYLPLQAILDNRPLPIIQHEKYFKNDK